jgi:hypothetical protein
VRRLAVERELREVEQRITRLVDAIANAGPLEELLARLKAERTRKAVLVEEQMRLTVMATETGDKNLLAQMLARAAALRDRLGRHVGRARQLLEAMLTGPVMMMPIVEDGRPGYRFSGRLRLDGQMLSGAGVEQTRHAVVAPTGHDRTCRTSARFHCALIRTPASLSVDIV